MSQDYFRCAELHGLKGYDEHIAKAIASARQAPETVWEKTAGDALTDDEAATIGKTLREAAPGNLVVGTFAAELVGQSYPFSKAQSDIVFRGAHRRTAWPSVCPVCDR